MVRLKPDATSGFGTASGSRIVANARRLSSLSSPATRGRRRRAHVTLTASLLPIFLAAWIVVPPFSPMWLPLAVAAPELSPWILLAATALALMALLDARIGTPARVALALSCIAAALAAWPLVRAARTAPRLAAAMSEALGQDVLRGRFG